MEFYNKFTGSCEVVVNDDLFKVYFPILPICRFLSSKSKKDFLENVPRDSPQLKINGFLSTIPDFIDEMEHAESLRHGKIKIKPSIVFKMRDICFLVSLIINAIILFQYEYVIITLSSGATSLRPELANQFSDIILFIMGIVLISCCSLLLFLWLITNYSLLNQKYWRDYIKENRVIDPKIYKDLESRNTLSIKPARETSLREVRRILRIYGVEAREFNYYGRRNFGHLIVKLEYYWLSFTFILKNGTFRYFSTLIFLAVAGFVFSPAFYSFHLLDIIYRFPILRDVIKSVTLNFKDLLVTALFGFVLIYIFAVVGFEFLHDMYFDEEVERDISAKRGDSTCKSLLQCVGSTIGYGLRMGGGIADKLSAQTYQDRVLFYFRAGFDLMFFLLVVIILLNIFSGIIIDTFAQLRDQKADFEDNKNNVCFICSIDRYEFDRNGDGFEKHIEKDHHVFNYFYYMIYINDKPKTEYNGTESNIGNDSSWFPFHKAIVLEKAKEKDKEPEDNVNHLKVKIESLEKLIATMEIQAKQ